MITCHEIINAADSVSKNELANVMITVSTNFHKMYCYILHSVLLVTVLLFIIAIV